MYLPIYLSATIFMGGLLSHFVLRAAHLRIDGTLHGEPSEDAIHAGEQITSKGLLLSAGMIAGEALMGVIVAVFIMIKLPANSWFGFLGTLGPLLSIAFFLWFFIVFTWLATRGMPSSKHGRGNLITDWIAVAVDGVRRMISSISVPSPPNGDAKPRTR